MRKTVLILARSQPHGSSRGPDLLDLALAAAAFDQRVCLVFLDDGVWQVRAEQNPGAIDACDFARGIGALIQMDGADILVERESMDERGLSFHMMRPVVRMVSRAQVPALIARADMVVAG